MLGGMACLSYTAGANAARAQVSHMREFIMHEAREKAEEIGCKAEQDYTVEKQRLVEEEKLRIKKDFERRQSNVDLESKIANATETNKNKLLVLSAAAVEVEKTFIEAFERLKGISNDAGAYQTLLKALITEGVASLGLPEVLVRCRAQDVAAVQQAISAVSTGAKISLDQTAPITVDTSVVNIPKECIGGVVVTSADGKIKCFQTLNSRLQVAYDTALPCIKPVLFNQQGSKHTDTM